MDEFSRHQKRIDKAGSVYGSIDLDTRAEVEWAVRGARPWANPEQVAKLVCQVMSCVVWNLWLHHENKPLPRSDVIQKAVRNVLLENAEALIDQLREPSLWELDQSQTLRILLDNFFHFRYQNSNRNLEAFEDQFQRYIVLLASPRKNDFPDVCILEPLEQVSLAVLQLEKTPSYILHLPDINGSQMISRVVRNQVLLYLNPYSLRHIDSRVSISDIARDCDVRPDGALADSLQGWNLAMRAKIRRDSKGFLWKQFDNALEMTLAPLKGYPATSGGFDFIAAHMYAVIDEWLTAVLFGLYLRGEYIADITQKVATALRRPLVGPLRDTRDFYARGRAARAFGIELASPALGLVLPSTLIRLGLVPGLLTPFEKLLETLQGHHFRYAIRVAASNQCLYLLPAVMAISAKGDPLGGVFSGQELHNAELIARHFPWQ